MPLLSVKLEMPSILKTEPETWSGEVVAFCPRCKALQTLWVSDNMLMPTRKFVQRGRYVYHECSSGQPCRLYYSW